eukprot:CAMPEP_0171102162 /NCGR_PEP_ID=MMETSP0766_2-20121228/57027_1 /TAXON_ID=439317 /ORGANISM="Gambierdiscus australes, Strain CAWD 149" /LENGTH=43 /DNA_ID= /DNA_START= /DNA_END= /DNA_ORIENTATION=
MERGTREARTILAIAISHAACHTTVAWGDTALVCTTPLAAETC